METEKRYQVFVSSTYEDLQTERREVIQALLELDCIPAGMELFQAADEDSWSLIKSVISDCDYYICISAGRYGTIHKDLEQSFTELEYRFATSQNLPTISFLHQDLQSLPSSVVDSGAEYEKLQEFRRLCQQKQVKYWTSAEQLGSVVSRSLVRLIKTQPAVGWVKADTLASDKAREKILELTSEIDELKSKLEKVQTAYEGNIEELIQGEDRIDVEYEATLRYGTGYYEKGNIETYDAVEVDELFKLVAPILLDEKTEQQIKGKVNTSLQSILQDKIYEATITNQGKSEEKSLNSEEIRISDDSFQVIKIQWLALGLIAKGTKRRAPSDRNTYFKITDRGESHLMKLVAKKRVN